MRLAKDAQLPKSDRFDALKVLPFVKSPCIREPEASGKRGNLVTGF